MMMAAVALMLVERAGCNFITSPLMATPIAPAPQEADQYDSSVAEIVDPAAATGTPSPPPALGQGDIVVTARVPTASDPLVAINAKSFEATQAVDDALVAPISTAYAKVLPAPIRAGLHNFLSNLHEPVISLNYLLQLKPGKAVETLGRFAINSTVGIAGLLDIAKKKPFRLPFRPNGFADTFGYYGVKPGPFLFLPIIGATTPRDLVGLIIDRAMLPLAVGRPFTRSAYTIPTGLLHTLDRRVAFDAELRGARESADPYVARRELYLGARQAEIDGLHGRRALPPKH